jgi:catechol 2,3-dioxygenase-like lactoylglutathione lyase family enzyme
MSFVEGVGGAFVFSRDPARLAEWYTEHLGLAFEGSREFGAFYRVFWALDPENTGRKIDTTFSIMAAKTEFPERAAVETEPEDMYGDQPFMVNLRVRDLDALIDDLAKKGVEPIRRDDEPYGKFAWIRDADGNRVELYEPLQDG